MHIDCNCNTNWGRFTVDLRVVLIEVDGQRLADHFLFLDFVSHFIAVWLLIRFLKKISTQLYRKRSVAVALLTLSDGIARQKVLRLFPTGLWLHTYTINRRSSNRNQLLEESNERTHTKANHRMTRVQIESTQSSLCSSQRREQQYSEDVCLWLSIRTWCIKHTHQFKFTHNASICGCCILNGSASSPYMQ